MPHDALVSLVYVSHARTPFSDADLVELLLQARESNAELGITGFLVYRKGTFIQILEGPDTVARDLLGRITADPRHERIRVLFDEPIPRRRFSEWSMGHEPIDPAAQNSARAGAAVADLDDDTDVSGDRAAVDELGDWFTTTAARGW